MGILSKNERETNRPLSTKDLYFGAVEAEGENRYGYSTIDYFEDFLDILSCLEKGTFVFVGRKGVGKSAIAKYIKDMSDKSEDSAAHILRMSDLNIENFIHESVEIENIDALLFEWLILVNLVKLVVKRGNGKCTKEYEKLKNFLERNTGSVEIDKFQINEIWLKKGGEVNFAVLTHIFGGIFKKYFDIKTTKAPFYKLIDPLKEVLKTILDYEVNKDFEYWLLFDDLDVNYDIFSEKDNETIMKLLRICSRYNNDMFKNNKTKILIFLREDVRNYIKPKYPDSAKILNSYETVINWYNDVSNDNNNPLKKLANKRIEKTFKKHSIEFGNDAWNYLFYNCIFYDKTSFKYILDFTFYRPRDIITFLSEISKCNYRFPIDNTSLKKILNNYIRTNIDEIKSELSLYFNDSSKEKLFKNIFNYIANNNDLYYRDVINKIEKEMEGESQLKSDVIFGILYNYSLLILKNEQDELFFNYREDKLIDDIENYKVSLPKCLYHLYKPILNY